MGITVNVTNNTDKMSKTIDRNIKDGFTDIVLDLQRTSSAAAPHKEGFLEKNKYRIKTSTSGLTGEVYFVAKRKKFDYAVWTHNANYNLGEKSKRKQGGKSKFASGVVPVGKGYLTNAVTSSEDGYIKHITEAYRKAVK